MGRKKLFSLRQSRTSLFRLQKQREGSRERNDCCCCCRFYGPTTIGLLTCEREREGQGERQERKKKRDNDLHRAQVKHVLW